MRKPITKRFVCCKKNVTIFRQGYAIIEISKDCRHQRHAAIMYCTKQEDGMKHAKRLTAAAMAGFIGAMSLFSGVTAYAATGWQQNGSTYYYYDANGELHKGWLNTENGYYYLNLSTGKMTVGWEKINNKWYYFQGNGVMATGWVKDNGKY